MWATTGKSARAVTNPLCSTTRDLITTYRITLAAVLFASLPMSPAHAATFNVTSNADSGAGSLRSAIVGANIVPNTPHTILFTTPYQNGGTIALLSALPLIEVQDLTISGGTRAPRINGQNSQQIFRVGATNSNLEISDLELSNGRSTQYGGCIEDAANVPPAIGTLRATRVIFSGCSTVSDSLVYGGAIYWQRNQGNVVITSSRFSTNFVRATTTNGQSGGGAISTRSNVTISDTLFENNGSTTSGNGGIGGALLLGGVGRAASISDSTFRGNAASPAAVPQTFGYGGAIALSCDTCSLQIVRSYFRGNAAIFGGAVYARKFSGGASDITLTLTNNSFVNNSVADAGGAVYQINTSLTLANNTFYNNDATSGAHVAFGFTGNSVVYALGNLFAPTLLGPACTGTATLPNPSLIGANLFSDASCGQISATSLPNSPLGTITLDETPGQIGVVRFTGSAVIDSISNNGQCEPRDARFQQRPIDGDGNGIARCDVGAYEHPSLSIFRDGFEN